MKEITPEELQTMRVNRVKHQLIDIRESYELAEGHIDGQHIPMEVIASRSEEIRRDCPVVIHCRSGKRAEAVITMLERKYSFSNLYSLQGGILAYAEQVDHSLEIS